MNADTTQAIGVERIMQSLPHRYPFLMVDRVLRFEAGVLLEAIKNVTINEPFFQGHFPGLPLMPGVLQLEALAQAGGLLLDLSSNNSLSGKIFLFTGMEKVRFRRPVRPGDQLLLRVQDFRQRLQLIKMSGTATVEGQVCCEAELTAAVVDREAMA
jgi:3-hydroxyacyl-[acyl-carrier-protein] dehydratase